MIMTDKSKWPITRVTAKKGRSSIGISWHVDGEDQVALVVHESYPEFNIDQLTTVVVDASELRSALTPPRIVEEMNR